METIVIFLQIDSLGNNQTLASIQHKIGRKNLSKLLPKINVLPREDLPEIVACRSTFPPDQAPERVIQDFI